MSCIHIYISYHVYIYSHTICSVLLSFISVAVLEGSSTSEIGKDGEEQTTQDPDVTSGKCPPPHLE